MTRRVFWNEELRAACQADFDAGLSDKEVAERNSVGSKQLSNALTRRIVTREKHSPGRKKWSAPSCKEAAHNELIADAAEDGVAA